MGQNTSQSERRVSQSYASAFDTPFNLAPGSKSHYKPRQVRIGRSMIRQAALHRLSIWLTGLFLVAQICAVVQLLGEHTAHMTESQLNLSSPVASANASGHHHYGDADGAIQHHVLQDLNGAPACLVVSCKVAVAHVATTRYVSDSLSGSSPALLERPPKSILSV